MKRIDEESILKINASQIITTLAEAIKELLENSIDASSTKIEVKCANMDITVIDNGVGIPEDSLELVGQRSTTCKLDNFDEIQKIKTFGFRGEAVNSMCCMGNVKISTCTAPPLGSEVIFDRMGNVQSMRPIARQQGTTTSITQIFHGFPVRHQECVRNKKRELNKILECVIKYAIGFPFIKYILTIDKKIMLETDGLGSVPTTISKILSMNSKSLLPLEYNGNDIQINGWISSPTGLQGRSDSDREYLYINKRPVQLKNLTRAINNTFREYNSTQYPVVALFINLNEDKFDRNVTPDKYTVFLEDNEQIVDIVVQMLVKIFEPTRGNLTQFVSKSKPQFESNVRSTPVTEKEKSQTDSSNYGDRIPHCRNIIGKHIKDPFHINLDLVYNSKRRITTKNYQLLVKSQELQTPTTLTKDEFQEFKVLGQFNKGFILAIHGNNIFIIDQHASDEKNMYEYFHKSKVTIQPLINAKKLILTPQQANLVQKWESQFKLAGFDLKLINENWHIVGVPQIRNLILGVMDFESILTKLQHANEMPICDRLERFYASKACRSAVMIGDTLTMSKMKGIVNQMSKLNQPWNCPHGRPTIRLLTTLEVMEQEE